MNHSPAHWIAVLMILVPSLCFGATSKLPGGADPVHFAEAHESLVLTSTSTRSALLLRESAGPDTFDLYGGASRRLRDPDGIPGNGDEYVEGKFEDSSGFLPRGLSDSPNDWTGVDLTDQPIYWNVAVFNAENLNANGSGNRAMWEGLPAGIPETAGWADAPGYGNNWNDVLIYESEPIADPAVGQTVGLDFFFNIDTELTYDFVYVEYDSAGVWIEVLELDGTNKDPLSGVFAAPGLRFSDLQTRPIVYTGNDYGFGDRIRVRVRFSSDGAYSDEDGFFVGDGAVQLDDITLTTSQGSFTEDFEGVGPFLFRPEKTPICGDFAFVFARVFDLDPCAENTSPQLGFIDFGQEPPNGPGVSGTVSTGGSVSTQYDYGIPGGFVVNFTAGLDGIFPLSNEAWSPEFDWDLPGPEDDDFELYGAEFAFSAYRHNPLLNGIFYVWHVRSFADGAWSTWNDTSFVFFSPTPNYLWTVNDVTGLIEQDPEKVQLAVGVVDLSVDFGFPGSDATPAPVFDDVRFRKFRIGGVSLTTRTIDQANDGFPVSGQIDVSTQQARDLLDVRFDMARDVSSGEINVPGDSVIVDARPVLPGTELASIRMNWALRLNPLFELAIRTPPARPQDFAFQSDVDGNGRTIWTGSVVMDSSRTASANAVIFGRYFADLPDEDLLYPGDILHYHFEAVDSDGRVTTLPDDTGGFGEWDVQGGSRYARTWTVRALPTIVAASGSQPSILVYNDFGRRGAEEEVAFAFAQQGLIEGVDYDTYTVQGPTSSVSNGLGSAGVVSSLGERRGHGANADQLGGYRTMVYISENLATRLLSDGSDTNGNDKSPDLAVLTAWKNLPGRRNTLYFGDSLASGLVNDSPVDGAAYLASVMGVDVVSADVRTAIGGQTAPVVRPTGATPAFTTPFVTFGGCFGINRFDHLEPSPAAFAGHGFVDPVTDAIYPDIAASVIHDRVVNLDRKVDITFPFGIEYVYDDIARTTPGAGARSNLLSEALEYVGEVYYTTQVTAAPTLREPALALHPNPFNPKTLVSFTLPREGVVARVEVYNVRGERVRVLHDGMATSADLRLEWNGTDERGARVASGVYLVKAVTAGFTGTKKAVLIK